MMSDEDFERWAKVKPEAVCGGSDAPGERNEQST